MAEKKITTDDPDGLVWAQDNLTKHEYPVALSAVEADSSRYKVKSDHPVRDQNGDVLAPVAHDASPISSAGTTSKTNQPATPADEK